MLKLAKLYEKEIQTLFIKIAFDEKFKFYNATNYYTYGTELAQDSWSQLEFVSVDKDDNVIGFLRAKIDRCNDMISSLGVINFYDLNYTFSKDFHQFLTELFTKHNFRKVEFSVVIGNPAEKMYDKYITKYGGRVVGTFKEETKLYDGKYYDHKVYEIFKCDFEKNLKL
jgi:RimJ/RimL family protein N-acetyltransferase